MVSTFWRRRGRILQIRRGINPNSSGHGILWGAMFFLPQFISGLLGGAIASELDKGFRREKVGSRWRLPAALAWGSAWYAFFLQWWLFTASTMVWQDLPPTIYLVLAVPATLIAYLYYRRVDDRVELDRQTGVALLFGTVIGVLFQLVIPLSLIQTSRLGSTVLSASAPACFALTRYVLRYPAKTSAYLWVYLVVGCLSIFPLIPIPGNSYNPVGILFPIWGAGFPYYLAIQGLWPDQKTVDNKLNTGGESHGDQQNPV